MEEIAEQKIDEKHEQKLWQIKQAVLTKEINTQELNRSILQANHRLRAKHFEGNKSARAS